MGKLDFQIKVKTQVNQETVERCLKIIEWWLNDNIDKKIVGGIRNANGKVDAFRIETREEYTIKKEDL